MLVIYILGNFNIGSTQGFIEMGYISTQTLTNDCNHSLYRLEMVSMENAVIGFYLFYGVSSWRLWFDSVEFWLDNAVYLACWLVKTCARTANKKCPFNIWNHSEFQVNLSSCTIPEGWEIRDGGWKMRDGGWEMGNGEREDEGYIPFNARLL